MSFNDIKNILGEGNYIDDPQQMEPYLTPWRDGAKGEAVLVALPDSAERISYLVKSCNELCIKLVPQGGNTGLVGGSTPASEDEIIINLSRLNKIREINTEDYTVTVEAGTVLENLRNAVAEKNMLFPISIASQGSCEVGGIISTNAGGVNVLHYGTTRDLVLGLEVVLPSGEIWHGLKKLRKDNAGYDLKQLFIGAEGTLGIITAASLRLFPQPKQVETAFLAIKDINRAVPLLADFREKIADNITAFEIISATALELVTEHIDGVRSPLSSFSDYYILAELATAQEGNFLKKRLEELLEEEFNSGSIIDATIAESLSHAQDFWRLRESISEAEKKAGKAVHFDISLPISQIADFINATDMKIVSGFPEAKIVNFGHIGDGNLHYNISFPKDVENFAEKRDALKEIVYGACIKRGGSISAEHGIGILRKTDLALYKSTIELEMMKKIKTAIDPENILNPNKIF